MVVGGRWLVVVVMVVVVVLVLVLVLVLAAVGKRGGTACQLPALLQSTTSCSAFLGQWAEPMEETQRCGPRQMISTPPTTLKPPFHGVPFFRGSFGSAFGKKLRPCPSLKRWWKKGSHPRCGAEHFPGSGFT